MRASRITLRAAVAALLLAATCGWTVGQDPAPPAAEVSLAAAVAEPPISPAPGPTPDEPFVHATGSAVPVEAQDAESSAMARLDIRVVDRAGHPATTEQSSYVLVFDLDGMEDHTTPLADGSATIEVPPGTYSVAAFVWTPEADGQLSRTLAIDPFVEVPTTGAGTTVVLDASRARRPIDVRVDRSDARPLGGIVLFRQPATGSDDHPWYAYDMGPAGLNYVTPTERVPGARLDVYSAFTQGGAATSPWSYHLVDSSGGRVPAVPSYPHRTRDLATLRSVVAAQGRPGCGSFRPSIRPGGEALGVGLEVGIGPAPGVHTSYHTPRPEPWRLGMSYTGPSCDFASGEYEHFLTNRTLATAGRVVEEWGTAPLGPAVAGHNALIPEDDAAWYSPARREGDLLTFAVPLLVDGEAGHYGEVSPWFPSPGASGTTTLSRDGEQLGHSDQPGIGSFTVGPEPAVYQLDTQLERSVPWSDLATTEQVRWTFTSAHAAGPQPDPLPFMAVRYDLDLDDHGRAPAGQPYQFGVQLESWPGAPVTTIDQLTVEASYDDGLTWQDVPLTATGDHGDHGDHGDGGGRWTASLSHPSGDGYVSLRARATDAAGNGVEQTVIRGYGLAAG